MTQGFALFTVGAMLIYSALKNQGIAALLLRQPAPSQPANIVDTSRYDAGALQKADPAQAPGQSAKGHGHASSTLTAGRIDQGQDFSGVGQTIPSPWTGRVISTSHPTGWPGRGGLIIAFDRPISGARYGYIFEDITVTCRRGQHVTIGQPVGKVAAGSSGIEIGFCDARGVPLGHSQMDPSTHHSQWGERVGSYLRSIGFTK